MAGQAVAGSTAPASHRLPDVAKYFMQSLSVAERQQLLEAAANARKLQCPLKVGTLCSGTDAAVPVLKHLHEALGGTLDIEHTFSCEFDKRKQRWIRDNFPDLKLIFDDVKAVGRGMALNIVTGQKEEVRGNTFLINL